MNVLEDNETSQSMSTTHIMILNERLNNIFKLSTYLTCNQPARFCMITYYTFNSMTSNVYTCIHIVILMSSSNKNFAE